MILVILAACSGIETGVISAEPGSEQEHQDTVIDSGTTPEETGVNCDDVAYPMGMTLVDLPPSLPVKITAVDTDGNVVYTETIGSDTCGVATPFQDVSVEDFGDTWDNWDHGVWAQVGSEATGYYGYQGILIAEGDPDTPVSTQWEFEDDGTAVAIHDPDLGVMIGIAMIP